MVTRFGVRKIFERAAFIQIFYTPIFRVNLINALYSHINSAKCRGIYIATFVKLDKITEDYINFQIIMLTSIKREMYESGQ